MDSLGYYFQHLKSFHKKLRYYNALNGRRGNLSQFQAFRLIELQTLKAFEWSFHSMNGIERDLRDFSA